MILLIVKIKKKKGTMLTILLFLFIHHPFPLVYILIEERHVEKDMGRPP